MKDKLDILNSNAKENYLYSYNISKYTELNQELYLWVIQEIDLPGAYFDENGNYIQKTVRFVVEAEKINRASLPVFNSVIGSFDTTTYGDSYNTYIFFDFPSVTRNRKFTLKIGKVTDNAILTKIKNNDYSGMNDLLVLAKNSKEIYSKELTTTDIGKFSRNDVLFDGRKLLEERAYYFIYVEFDDENGKYYPREGVTLGQAYLSDESDKWGLYSITNNKFNWDDFNSTYTDSGNKVNDPTVSNKILPNTGINVIIIGIMVITISITGIMFYKKYNNYKDIK